jgi:hypothetical protein
LIGFIINYLVYYLCYATFYFNTFNLIEPLTGIEPVTSSLPRKCSTPELQWLKKSERPGSNRLPSAWKADALPNELLSLFNFK